jgi:peptidoglycan/xylan/chitin deacetylase (PgdA/CDA1 family)
MKTISIGYHDVYAQGLTAHNEVSDTCNIYSLSHDQFRSHLRGIRDSNCPVGTVDAGRNWNSHLPVFLTFDDGALSAYSRIAPELEKYGWRGHFFVVTDWIGKRGFLNRQQICELRQRGHVIGSHSKSHPERMSELCRDELIDEWEQSRGVLSSLLRQPVKIASVPNGYYNDQVGLAAAAAGIEVLFTSEPTASVDSIGGCVVLGRYFVRKHDRPSVSAGLAAGRVWPKWRQSISWAVKKPVKKLAGVRYIAARRYLISKGLQ